jgi:hypothetical protein
LCKRSEKGSHRRSLALVPGAERDGDAKQLFLSYVTISVGVVEMKEDYKIEVLDRYILIG